MKTYTCTDYIEIYLERQHWSYEIRKYNFHLIDVLSKAFGIDLEFLFYIKYQFLENIITVQEQLQHPLSGTLEIGTVLEDFPALNDILKSVDKQSTLLMEIVKKVVENEYPKEFQKVVNHNELIKYGYDKGLEPDSVKI